jgi:hypothetical protein
MRYNGISGGGCAILFVVLLIVLFVVIGEMARLWVWIRWAFQ